ncbi:MFS transporter [Nonomuraea sp. NPDC050790]|uniref:MFS transporter n=1 Tax=Nonomuraea sp. NPDC050790 TaxID=3364371 RepID=UPI003792C4BF
MNRLMLASASGLLGFYLLFSAVPRYLGDGMSAGMATAALMLGTVLLELAVPWLLSRYGYRRVLSAGLILLGPPSLALPLKDLVLPISLLRGAGLGIVVVAGTALVAELIPAERRSEGLGLYGVAVGVPSIIGLPLGLWAGDHLGFGPVFVLAGLVPLAGLVAAAKLPDLKPAQHRDQSKSGNGLTAPIVVFGAVALAAGVAITFLPLAASPKLASAALLAQSLLTPAARWWAGRHAGPRWLAPSVLAAAAGVGLLFWSAEPWAVVAGMALFGAGFGVAQNLTLTLMFERGQAGRVSAMWNLAYDAGMGVGALGLGVVMGATGYPLGFALVAVVVLATLPLTGNRKPSMVR